MQTCPLQRFAHEWHICLDQTIRHRPACPVAGVCRRDNCCIELKAATQRALSVSNNVMTKHFCQGLMRTKRRSNICHYTTATSISTKFDIRHGLSHYAEGEEGLCCHTMLVLHSFIFSWTHTLQFCRRVWTDPDMLLFCRVLCKVDYGALMLRAMLSVPITSNFVTGDACSSYSEQDKIPQSWLDVCVDSHR